MGEWYPSEEQVEEARQSLPPPRHSEETRVKRFYGALAGTLVPYRDVLFCVVRYSRDVGGCTPRGAFWYRWERTDVDE